MLIPSMEFGKIMGNFNFLLHSRRRMPSGSGDGTRVSLLLVMLMILPTLVSASAMTEGGIGEVLDDPNEQPWSFSGNLGVPQTDDPSHGWYGANGIGEAWLFHRIASYVPLLDWTGMTGEKELSGWYVLGHEYPIPTGWTNELSEMGITCQTFYSPQGFHCDVPGIPIGTLLEAGVIGTFTLDTTDRMAPDLIYSLDPGSVYAREDGKRGLSVLLSGSGHLKDLESGGIEIDKSHTMGRVAEVFADTDEVGWMVSRGFVEWVEPSFPIELDNARASDIINVDWVTTPVNMGGVSSILTGEGVIVAVMDSGLGNSIGCVDLADCSAKNTPGIPGDPGVTIHQDISGRVEYIESFHGACADDGPGDDNGHGTHVVGSVLGDGSSSAAQTGSVGHAGMAPGAHLYMQSVQCGGSGGGLYQPSGDCWGSDDDGIGGDWDVDCYDGIFQPAYTFGARVHSNSWGTGPDETDECPLPGSYCPNYYGNQALAIDYSAHNLNDMTILFAMGNDGSDGNADGEINLAYMNRQATAKNILSIGASENDVGTNYRWGPSLSFPTDPIANDKTANKPDGMAAFSNRGPTNDGRIKPDLVAPGTVIVSHRGDQVDGDCITPPDSPTGGGALEGYCVNQGTSMATPITAGAVALMIEHLKDNAMIGVDPKTNSGDPASALIKALLAAGSHDMAGQYNYCQNIGGTVIPCSGGYNSAQEPAPNPHEGWGRLDMQGAVGAAATESFLDGVDISTGDSHSMMLTVPVGTNDFRFALSWTDPPNSPSAGKQLINDIDFELRKPDGSVYPYTNDDLNNLVGLTVSSPDAGKWELIITGANIADSSPQTYYLAVRGTDAEGNTSEGLVISDMRRPSSAGMNAAGSQGGSIFTETTIDVGSDHVCAIFDDSSMNCWGSNQQGQIGDGTDTDRMTMTEVDLGTGRKAVSISTGDSHTCATLDDATLKCWGDNSKGQLGDGTTLDRLAPVPVPGLSGASAPVQISAGSGHTCAVISGASLMCWGDNSNGQLGDGTTLDRLAPVAVPGLSSVVAVSAGSQHTCAIDSSDLKVRCWGSNSLGQLGDGTQIDSASPVTLDLGGGVVAISAGASHTCAILENMSLRCWGDGSGGKLGYGDEVTLTDASIADSVMTSVVTVEAGDGHTCASHDNGTLKCWGTNSGSQLGDGGTISSPLPTTVSISGNHDPLSLAAGEDYTCSIASNDLLYCWGGQGGNPAFALGSVPERFEMQPWTYMRSSERDLDGNAVLNIFQTGVPSDADGDGFPSGPTDTDDNDPTRAANCNPGQYGRYTCKDAAPGYYASGSGNIVMTPASPGHKVSNPGASDQTQCLPGSFQELEAQTVCELARPGYYISGLGASSGTPCPGGSYNPSTGSQTDADCIDADEGYNVPILTKVSSGSYHTCVILDDGSVSCWGDNSNGQLGDGSRTDRNVPAKVVLPEGKRAVSLSSGSSHTCASMEDGDVLCWGGNDFGQLGDGTVVERLIPVSVDLGEGDLAAGISAGASHTCARLVDNRVVCWGANAFGQLGDGTTLDRITPVDVDVGEDGVALLLSAGSYHTCAITSQRNVECWGDNWQGQLGEGTYQSRNSPTSVLLDEGSSTISLSSGSLHTCAGLNNGSVYCWGFNAYGQIGLGSINSINSPSEAPLEDGFTPMQVSSGVFHSCTLMEGGEVFCWGFNEFGQLGEGTTTSTWAPQRSDLPVGRKALAISSGSMHTCAILDDATLKCWGGNERGQLGVGTNSDLAQPELGDVSLGHGSGSQIACSPGSYQPNKSGQTCILADRGYEVPDSNSTNQTGCNRGYFSSVRGQASCSPAGLGYYVDTSFADTQIACPEKNSTRNTASNNPDQCKPDFDGDRIIDDDDDDDDNDGVVDSLDFDKFDPLISTDSDGDNIPDALDDDDDNDGVNDTADLFPFDQMEWKDNDGDGIGDNADDDDDGDGRSDMFDVFPDDPVEWSDYDGDGIGDNADLDDDNDGVPDVGVDGGIGDVFPFDVYNWMDTDGDSIGDNNDTDKDNDGYENDQDTFPLDPTEWIDSDGDTFGDNIDWDDEDPTEWLDRDGDEVGDAQDDLCPNVPGINQSFDNFEELMAAGNFLGCPEKEEDGLTSGTQLDGSMDSGDDGDDDSEQELEDTDGDGIMDEWDDDDDSCGVSDAYWESMESEGLTCNDGFFPGDRIIDSEDGHSKDPARPFSQNVWISIVVSAAFVGLMGQRMFNWQKRQAAKLKSKRIRLR